MVELVWDVSRVGTATAPSGASATVGDDATYSPDDLLAMAAAGCHMRTFLRLAGEAGVPVLSYAAAAELEPAGAATAPRVRVRTYVVAPGSVARSRLTALLDLAALNSPVSQALGGRVLFQSDIRVLAGSRPA
jgi:organic hydroperoxide reductase OsmC/OhrA